jgi:hypothetical protein
MDDWMQEAVACSEQLLSETQLARRWRMSCRSLQRWRANGSGPPFYRIGHAIRYRISNVLAYEAAVRHQGTAVE